MTSGAKQVCYLEGLFVRIGVIAPVHLFGLAEQDEVFKEEHVPQRLSPSTAHDKLVLAPQLPLLLQVHLQTSKPPSGTLGPALTPPRPPGERKGLEVELVTNS